MYILRLHLIVYVHVYTHLPVCTCRIVKLSSPPLSAVSIVGIMLLFLLVVFLGIDEGVASLEVESAFCVVNLWIGVIAFTLVYGSMLSKAFRVYYIFKNIKISKQKQAKVRS